MKRLNDYFFSTSQRKEIEYRMWLCGKLEAMLGNYYLYGAGIPVNSFEKDEFYIDREMKIPLLLKNIIWIDDDFMNDENIEFDFEAFDIIDSGEKYINPKHFSVMDLVNALYRERSI